MKIQNFTIVISFFCIWITTYFSQQIQLISAFILIITFGILHGSNDIVLLNKIKETNFFISPAKLLFCYVLVVLSTVLLFYFVPVIALLIFITISAFHFGEQHWNKKLMHIKPLFRTIYQMMYGFFILFLLFNFQPNEVIKVIFEISAVKIATGLLFTAFLFFSIILFLMTTYLYIIDKSFISIILLEVFYILVFAIIFKMTTLIWGFAIYFIFWHSIPSLIDQISFLYGGWNKNNFILYCKSAFWYWIISIIGIFILYFTLSEKRLFEGLFFSFLAAVTFPHVIVIITMNNQKPIEKLIQ